MDALWMLALVTLAAWGRGDGQSATQPEREAVAKEGESVHMNCTYDSGFPTLMWYMQGLNRAPQFILQDASKGDELEATFKHRFTARVDREKKTFPLTISGVRLADTAMYYCVLRVGSTYTRALIFGHGTKLTVQPPGDQAVSLPSVFVLRSEGAEDDKSACLAKDFYPKEVAIFMNTSSTNTGLQKAVSILSNSGKYSAVHVSNFSRAEDVHCTVQHQGADVTDKEGSRKPKDGPTAAPKQAQECEPTQSTPIVHSNEKVNTLSLTVMGLRVLFAKSLAFNFLLSAKFFMF